LQAVDRVGEFSFEKLSYLWLAKFLSVFVLHLHVAWLTLKPDELKSIPNQRNFVFLETRWIRWDEKMLNALSLKNLRSIN